MKFKLLILTPLLLIANSAHFDLYTQVFRHLAETGEDDAKHQNQLLFSF